MQTPLGAMLKPMIEQMTPQGGNQMESANDSQSANLHTGRFTNARIRVVEVLTLTLNSQNHIYINLFYDF